MLCSSSYSQRAAVSHYYNQELRGYMASFLSNPALQFENPDTTYTDVSLGYEYIDRGELYLIETGNGSENIDFSAHSLRRKETFLFYGTTAYNRGKNYNVNWCDVLDYQKIAPYIVADSSGGTSINESYLFSGGFAYRWNKMALGVEANYKAGNSFRTLDPRPLCTTSDFKINAGFAFDLKNRKIAFNAIYNTYKQKFGIKAYRPQRGCQIYYMKGPGIYNKNLTSKIEGGKAVSDLYTFDSYGVSLQTYSHKTGFFSSISYYNDVLYLKNGNENNSYYHNQLKTNNYKTEVGWQKESNFYDLKIKCYGNFIQKRGTEHENNSSYKNVSKDPRYNRNQYSGGVKSILFCNKETSLWQQYVEAGVLFFHYQEEYTMPGHIPKTVQKYDRISPELNLGINLKNKKSALTVKLFIRYDYCKNKKIKQYYLAIPEAIDKMIVAKAIKQAVIPDFNYYSADRLYLSPEVRYDFTVTEEIGMYFRANQINEIYSDYRNLFGINIALGLTL